MSSATIGWIWIASGYIGALLLIIKGYVGELAACATIAGGLPILLPAVLGPLLLLAAILLPAKWRKKKKDD
jgi:hypothetical protein